MDSNIDAYIQKQPSPQKEVCEQLRKLIHKTFPKMEEEMRWGVPTFAGGKFYIGSLKDHVNLGFSIVGLHEKEIALFDGGGKLMRHVKVASVKDIDEKRIATLLKLVHTKATCGGC